MTAFSLVVDIAGAALFALVGLGVLVLSRGRRRGLLVGAAATTFGMTWVFQNLADGILDWVEVGLWTSSLAATVAVVALARDLARGARPQARRGLVALGLVLTVIWLAAALLAMREFGWVGAALSWGTYGALLFALVLLVAAIAVAFGEAGAASRGLACLGLAFGPFIAFLTAGFAGSAGFNPQAFGTGQDVVFLLMGCATAAAAFPFHRGLAASDHLSRAVFPALIASGLAGLALVLAPGEYDGYGAFGVLRTLGAFFLALAVLSHDFLGVELPRLAARRGTLATGALAALFIVAQIAQEFFASEYGLLLGGVVAGALLFAANPIQRAMERMSERPVPARPALGAAAVPSGATRLAYKRALRLALRDRRLTHNEELEMARLAEDLGIGAASALVLRREVEAELAAGGGAA